MSEDYIPFEKALQDLKMSEDELKRLVSADGSGHALPGRHHPPAPRGRRALASKDDADELAEELVFADDLDSRTPAWSRPCSRTTPLLEEGDPRPGARGARGRDRREDDVIRVPVAPHERTRRRSPTGPNRRDPPDRHTRRRGEALDKVIMVIGAVILTYALFFAYSITQAKNHRHDPLARRELQGRGQVDGRTVRGPLAG
ncbi:MAG: hypothetical protein R3F30_12650 [Planctomycetota bacterium]